MTACTPGVLRVAANGAEETLIADLCPLRAYCRGSRLFGVDVRVGLAVSRLVRVSRTLDSEDITEVFVSIHQREALKKFQMGRIEINSIPEA